MEIKKKHEKTWFFGGCGEVSFSCNEKERVV